MTSRKDELSEFLRSRRARLTPAEVGLSATRNGRRVAGLRREELAQLAGVSPDYYARLEQGRATNVSEQVLDAVSTALRLDPLERNHLVALMRPTETTPVMPRVRPALRAMVAALDPTPAVLHGPRLEVLAVNGAAARLIHDFAAMPAAERNMVRWMFLDPAARRVYPDWADVAAQMVAILRVAAGRDAADVTLNRLVDELRSRSTDFEAAWSARDLFQHTHGPKRFHHDAVGTITLNYETMHLPADPGLSVIVYTAPAGSPSEAKLRELVGTR
ncbi:helix-turn-helix domain-containing protein [Mycobacterium yunnanensis]|uniref:Helix-turn-helix domain-containing protein n=1 Tax=Mycobacterium yunnanensis TaxID=368477 RepID=A0A9X2Z751_9MYCO|nr:helix-turn-helix transcriptional regulator [Mycobacterium yunnanensis]MCV7423296.1 helix-turn-helix domain-containing protein [Mycobacterium yunnanensis]